jgi:ribonuclease HI
MAQGVNRIEVHGAEGHTSNNEMELRAICEALRFLGNNKGYAVIESDSQSCLEVMLGRGQKWEADNFTRLNGLRVKNQGLVSEITARLRSFNVEFRKVKGHNNDPWNDTADALADQGRDEAKAWPKCTFDIVTRERSIAFVQRPVRPEEAAADVYAQLKHETSEKIPNFSDVKLYKEGDEFPGPWETGHFRFRHKSLPPQAGPAPKPTAPAPAQKVKPIKCGVWNGTSFIPTQPIDLSIPREEKTRIIKEAFDVGDDYRFFVHDTEVKETELKAGHQYSIYPARFERTPDTAIETKDKTPALRTEGPMISIQCIVLSGARASLMLPFSVKVPEEISLAQLWHRHVANRVKRHIEIVKWGKHFRGSAQIEESTITDLADKDSIEIIIPAEPAPTGQLEVVYTLEGETAVNRFLVKSTATMGDVRSRISMMHKGKPIKALEFEGSIFDDADNFSDWLFRTGGLPRQIVAKIQPIVQVRVDYMGVEKQMTVREGISKAEFLGQVKTFWPTSHNLDVIAHIPGEWEIRAG